MFLLFFFFKSSEALQSLALVQQKAQNPVGVQESEHMYIM